MQCPKCGTDIPEGLLYCEKCGEEIQIVPDYDPLLDVKVGEESETEKKEEPPAGPTQEITIDDGKKHKKGLYAMRAILIVLAIVVITLIYLTQKDFRRTNSFEYQLEQAQKARSLGDYEKAVQYYSRAVELDEGNVQVLEELADVYFLQNNQAWYEAILRKIISHKESGAEQIHDAYEKLIRQMIKKGEFSDIATMLLKCKDTGIVEIYEKYLSPKPELSLEEGTYYEMKSVQIIVNTEKEGKIYYTLDGSVPGENGLAYSMPILLEKGKTTLRACFINEYGVKSEIAEAVYSIEDPVEEEETKE